ncbi:MAG: glycine zipper 2TM domain-containing protein [Methylotenera sp.]|nr:glycine zipper 2TM domain-containing protein [Methylotenera sp.]
MRQTLLLGLVAVSVSLPAFADDDYEDRARVISVTPQTERVNTPRQECHTEYVRESVYEQPQRSVSGAIIGGIAGGLLGNTIGRGNGRIAAAAVGAGLGALVGDRVDNSNRNGREHVESRPVERCVTVDNWQTVSAGYLVSYEYNGRQYSTLMNQDPGRYIPVQVQVKPSRYVTQASYNDDNWREDRGRKHHQYQDRHYW